MSKARSVGDYCSITVHIAIRTRTAINWHTHNAIFDSQLPKITHWNPVVYSGSGLKRSTLTRSIYTVDAIYERGSDISTKNGACIWEQVFCSALRGVRTCVQCFIHHTPPPLSLRSLRPVSQCNMQIRSFYSVSPLGPRTRMAGRWVMNRVHCQIHYQSV